MEPLFLRLVMAFDFREHVFNMNGHGHGAWSMEIMNYGIFKWNR